MKVSRVLSGECSAKHDLVEGRFELGMLHREFPAELEKLAEFVDALAALEKNEISVKSA